MYKYPGQLIESDDEQNGGDIENYLSTDEAKS